MTNDPIIQKLKELGYTTIDPSWYSYVEGWDSWYKGDVARFHNYTVYNGQKKVRCHRYSLGMPKKVCEDWANLLMNEKVQITLEGETEQAFIDDVFEKNNFEVNMNELQEKGAARGTYAVIPHVSGARTDANGSIQGEPGARIIMDYLTAENIFPLTWRGREVTECAFTSTVYSGQDRYTYLQIHTTDKAGKYVIENHIYKSSADGGTLTEAALADVKGYESVPERLVTGSDMQPFVVGRYNIVNNLMDNVPMGIPVFANAIDIIKGIDKTFDSYVNEFDIGKKRVMVKPAATKTLEGDPVFDSDDLIFYVLPEDVGDGTIIQPIDMTLRTAEHNAGLQDMLNLLSSKCGFGEQHYKFDQGNVSTATQIISENSEMFRTIKKHEIILESVLVKLCRILLHMGNTYMGLNLNEDVEISVDFDDSIIEDRASDEAKVYQMLSAGLMGAVEARAILMNEDEETARKALPKLEELADEEQEEIE